MVKSTSSADAIVADDHPSTIAISYIPATGIISGFSTPVATSNGIESLSSLSILSESTSGHLFTFTSPRLADRILSTGAAINIDRIEILNTITNCDIFTNIAINFEVLGIDGESYPETCTVTITADVTDSSMVISILSVEWPTVSSFTVSKTSSGTVTYTLTVESKNNTLTIIYDPLYILTFIMPNVMFI